MKQLGEYIEGQIKESSDKEFVLNALANKDINASIDGSTVKVDKDDVKATKVILKKLSRDKDYKVDTL